MHVILNSDVLHTKRLLATGLPGHLAQFCRDCLAAGATLVLPRTVVLEDQRHQTQLTESAIADLESAAALLSQWRVDVPAFNARSQVSALSMEAALRATGVQVEAVTPLLEDYLDAERRASLHLVPQAPDTKSDEMRDLVIWAVAIRIARREGIAMLVSQDNVHVGERGREEAESVGLVRVANFDQAAEALGRSTPAGQLARKVLAPVWDRLRTAGLPLPESVDLKRFSDLQFSADATGHASGSLGIVANTPSGPLSAHLEVFQTGPTHIQANLRDIRIGKDIWASGELSVSVSGELPLVADPFDERFAELRQIVGGSG